MRYPAMRTLLAMLAVCGWLVGGWPAATRAADRPSPAQAAIDAAAEPTQRLREGSKLVDQLGYFKLTGDGLMFVSAEGGRQYGGLPNLALERVSRIVGDSPDRIEWSVSGLVTEFRGANYLLMTQAVIKMKAAPARVAPPAAPAPGGAVPKTTGKAF